VYFNVYEKAVLCERSVCNITSYLGAMAFI
jgi:hypothetical protein